MSGNQLALAADVPQSHLSAIERGARRATDEVLAKLAPHLGVTLEEAKALRDAEDQWRESPEYQEKMWELWQERMAQREQIQEFYEIGGAYPPTDFEIAIIRRAQKQGWTPGAVKTPDLWAMPPERRRDVFDRIKGLIEVQDAIKNEGRDGR